MLEIRMISRPVIIVVGDLIEDLRGEPQDNSIPTRTSFPC